MRDEGILSHKGCLMFLSWIFFNGLQIGGWLMLGIVLAGIMVLAVTHVLGIRNMRRPQQRQLSRILWVEAVTKSRLARFVWKVSKIQLKRNMAPIAFAES